MHSGNVVYEVQATVHERVRVAWEVYMQSEHVPEVLAAGGFVAATFERTGGGRYRVRYLARDAVHLERYRLEVAPGLRKAAVDRFPDGVVLTRDEWEVVAAW
jgi:hypothetical protein